VTAPLAGATLTTTSAISGHRHRPPRPARGARGTPSPPARARPRPVHRRSRDRRPSPAPVLYRRRPAGGTEVVHPFIPYLGGRSSPPRARLHRLLEALPHAGIADSGLEDIRHPRFRLRPGAHDHGSLLGSRQDGDQGSRVGAERGAEREGERQADGVGGRPAEGARFDPPERRLEQPAPWAAGHEGAAALGPAKVVVPEAFGQAVLLEARQPGVEKEHRHPDPEGEEPRPHGQEPNRRCPGFRCHSSRREVVTTAWLGKNRSSRGPGPPRPVSAGASLDAPSDCGEEGESDDRWDHDCRAR